jgi:hypothetical protein
MSKSVLDGHVRYPFETLTRASSSPQWPEGWTFGQYLHDTKEGCCNIFFNSLDCSVKDSCTDTYYTITPTEPTTKAEESCESRLFHPTTNFQSCTNRLVLISIFSFIVTIHSSWCQLCLRYVVWTTLKAGCGQAWKNSTCSTVKTHAATNSFLSKERTVKWSTNVTGRSQQFNCLQRRQPANPQNCIANGDDTIQKLTSRAVQIGRFNFLIAITQW